MSRTSHHPRTTPETQRLPVRRQIAPSDGETSRQRYRLNYDWEFHRGEEPENWETVNLPHSVRLEPLNASGGRNYQGICWYRKNLSIEPTWKGRAIYLKFEGAMQVAEVWINDRKVASNHCGYLPFTVDITSTVAYGAPNELRLRLDNRDNPQVPPGKPQRQLDFTYFGGLYRNVWLEVLAPLHISDCILADEIGGGGIFVTFPHVSPQSASVQIRVQLRNIDGDLRDCQLRQELIDGDGMVVASTVDDFQISAGSHADFIQTLEVSHPQLWHPHHPHLYTLQTTLSSAGHQIDYQLTRIGIRHIRFDKDHGLFINGERFVSIGANRHQDHPYVGYALPDNQHGRDVKKLREAGFTSFRSHYPQAPAFMDACDELGMLAIVSNPGWQFVGDELFQKRAIENARRMVRRDRNRPSVILWEAALNESENSPLAAPLQQAIHEEYLGDQCFTAGDREANFANVGFPGWDVEYLHNDGSKPYWIREWGDHVDNWSDQQSRSRVRRAWGETPMLIQSSSRLLRLDQILRDGDRLAGACLWAAIDCQRGYHQQPFYGGVLDAFRLPKFNYYLFQSQRPPNVHVPGLDDGPMVFIANYVTFLSPLTLTIFSNCDEVRLLLDGREIGRKRPDAGHAVAHPPFTFEMEYFVPEQSTMYMNNVAHVETPPTELIAEGLIDGKVVARHIVHPPGAPAKLVLEADLCGRPLVADGADWIRVHARICDARGTLCPLADDQVEFSVESPGAIIGDQSIGANPICAEAGIATALVRAGREPAKMKIRAAAFGLASGEIAITSVKI
jgi:beta-galactosidase